MKARTHLQAARCYLYRSQRKSAAFGSRVHIQLRELLPREHRQLEREARATFAALGGVRWVRFNRLLRRMIVERGPDGPAVEELIAKLSGLESNLGLSEREISTDAALPGDREPERRALVELSADLLSLLLGLALRRSKWLRLPLNMDVDLVTLLATLEGTPRLRQVLQRALGRAGTELLFELSKALVQLLMRSEAGPMAGVLRNTLAYREARSRRRVWLQREAELCSDPAYHARARAHRKRAAPLRRGVVERYEDNAVPAALSVFGLAAVFTNNVDAASPALVAGLPRVARLGRWAYSSQLAFELSERGVMVLDRDALERLDRIDVIVVPRVLLEQRPRAAERFLRAVRRLGYRLVVVGPEASEGRSLSREVRRLQHSGQGVLLVAQGEQIAYRDADCALSLSSAGPPWGAHLIAAQDWDDAAFLIDALEPAAQAAKQGVLMAAAEAATAVALSFGGLKRRTAQQTLLVANAAAMLVIANGVRLARELRRPVEPEPPPQTAWHGMTVEQVLERIGSRARGLSEAEVSVRRRPVDAAPTGFRVLARKLREELQNPLTSILIGGIGISALSGATTDAALIASALALNALVGATQGYRTERALRALDRNHDQAFRVLRVEGDRYVPRGDLVPGDVLILEAGEAVPADCRLIDASALEVDESSLTGESLPSAKTVEPTPDAELAARYCMLYEGTSVAAGTATAVVVALDEETQAGRAKAEAAEGRVPRGVEARLQQLAAMTAPVAGASALVMTASGLLRDRPMDQVLNTAVSLGVAAVPEGLPILSTMAELSTARRLAKHGALVRNPRALEALGRVNVLCADKTGTLTEGQIRLHVVTNGADVVHVSQVQPWRDAVLVAALRASPIPNGSPLPHATDRALVEGAAALGLQPGCGLRGWERLDELPFEPERGFHACLDRHEAGLLLSVKGAIEVVLPRCSTHFVDGEPRPLNEAARAELARHVEALARRGYRVLTVAAREPSDPYGLSDASVEQLTLRGFVGYTDPVRSTAREALATLRQAGVRVLMVTGDHPSTAEAIAAQLGMLDEVGGVLTGAELDALDDATLIERLRGLSVIARVTPSQKVRIVRALQSTGDTVAMTGDGANDAPAIQLADVGIALGAKSTAAARAAADLVVPNGRIETLVQAVVEGRGLWTSVRDAVSILVGGNLGEIGFTVGSGIASGKSALNTRQILLVNLLTDIFPALAIASRPPKSRSAEGLLREGPEASLGQQLNRDLAWRASITASAAGAAFGLLRATGSNAEKAGSGALLTLTGAQLGQTLMSGGRSPAVAAAGFGSLAVSLLVVEMPGVSRFFGCRPLGPLALAQVAAITLAATGTAAFVPRLRALRLSSLPLRAWGARVWG